MAIVSSKQSPQPDGSKKPSQAKSVKQSKPQQTDALLQPEAAKEEFVGKQDDKLRPQRFDEYIGQRELKEVLDIAIQATKSRQEALDHLLLYGPPGLGKTTISLILAAELGVNCKVTSAPALERPRDIVGLLVNLQPRDILFIDEIHRLSRMTE